uniref:SAP domain containing protein n=2 Tax=Solanum TaxID=4107 RepID=M1CMR5_SOLTU
MDQIKTHCYVTYSSVEEATETRNAVYNLQWPPNGGRLLVADFVDPQQVQTKIEGREPASPPKVTSPAVPASSSVQTPPAQQQGRKQQAELEHSLTRQPPPAPPSAPPTKEMLPSPVADKNDPPIVTLDDLFRKTKATPRIYYLPLTDEEVAKKLAIRGNAKP